ncbi:MAG TPA: VWA domain-containing protein [Terriglobia bacterium]|nr:VWA domain-containing protein [Terriglobia bacterium]
MKRWAFILVALGCGFIPLSYYTQNSPSDSNTVQSVAVKPSGQTADFLSIPDGEKLILELQTSLNTASTREGTRADFKTTEDFLMDAQVVIPRQSRVEATVTEVHHPGRVKGRANLRLRFDQIVLADGTKLPFHASIVRAGFAKLGKKGEGQESIKGEKGSGGSLVSVAAGAAQGAIMGGVFGGGKGAAYGGAAGAAVGMAEILLKRGPELDLPRNMLFEVQLDDALNVPAKAALKSTEIAHKAAAAAAASAGSESATAEAIPNDGNESVPNFSRDRELENRPVETAKADAPPIVPTPSPGTVKSSAPDNSTPDDPDAYKLRVNVQMVMIDAIVRDRTGRLMDNLKQADFRVYEDGVEQKVTSFSRDQLPLAVALVVDRSGSVAPFINELRHAAYRALSQLKRGDQVALFTFAAEVQRLEELTPDRQRIADRIAEIRAGGGTNITDALFDATYYLSAAGHDRRRAVILVSDNEATVRGRASQSELIRMAMESETVVYSIKTPGESMPITMRLPDLLGGKGSVSKVTHETGGEIIDVQRTGSLDAALADVVSRLKLRYTLGYNSTNFARDGTFRKIEVRLTEPYGRSETDYSVYARKGYYAPTERVARQAKEQKQSAP